MSLVPERFRPFVAFFLGMIATAFGQLYLRRWLRAVGWLAVSAVVTYLFVPMSVLETVAQTGEVANLSDIYPAAVVQFAAAFDALLLAYRERTPDRTSGAAPTPADAAEAPATVDAAADADVLACPNCGKEVDADLGFCHWCTTEFTTPERESA